jgi:GrpB-like predicted nucleotidyltransferase (UPF0157 family)
VDETTQITMKKYEILPYKTEWPLEFQEIAVGLRSGLGSHALRIDHIGSTSVQDLAAKDVIDIQITVAALDLPLKQKLEALGYQKVEGVQYDHCPPTLTRSLLAWEKWLFKPLDGQRRLHIHIRVQGRPNQRYPLLFRDYLRAHPAIASAYALLKRRLVANLADISMYPDVKDPAVDLIYFAAEEWAAAVGWQPGQSDA